MYGLDSIQRRYGGRPVLDIEHLEVGRGEILAIVGPSGSGKSTLLRLMQFLERPSSGRIVFDGRPIEVSAPLDVRRCVTTVFQHPLMFDRSVRDNIAYGLRLRGRNNARAVVDRLIDELGLRDRAAEPAPLPPGGEAQRVALARALAVEPDALLLDEPTANLDPYNVGLIENMIREQQRRGVTIGVGPHHGFQARRLGD